MPRTRTEYIVDTSGFSVATWRPLWRSVVKGLSLAKLWRFTISGLLWLLIVVAKVALFVNARMFIGFSCVSYVKHPSTKQSLAHAERLKNDCSVMTANQSTRYLKAKMQHIAINYLEMYLFIMWYQKTQLLHFIWDTLYTKVIYAKVGIIILQYMAF
jgi:hypothetical protein